MKASDQNIETRVDVQECIRKGTKKGFKLMSHRFKSGDQDKKKHKRPRLLG